MAGWILLAMLGIPFLEVVVFIEIGGRIGLSATVAVIIVTAVIGTALLKIQGIGVLNRARAVMARGEMPVEEVFDGLCLLVAGIVFLTPGFVTDALGAVLFIPAARRALRVRVASRIATSGGIHVHARTSRPEGSVQIEGEYSEQDDGDNSV